MNKQIHLEVLPSVTTAFVQLGSCKIDCNIELLLHKHLFILSLFPAGYWMVIQPGRDIFCHGIRIGLMCVDPSALPTTSYTQIHKSCDCNNV